MKNRDGPARCDRDHPVASLYNAIATSVSSTEGPPGEKAEAIRLLGSQKTYQHVITSVWRGMDTVSELFLGR